MENHPLHKFVGGQKNQSSTEACVSGEKSSITEVHPFRPCRMEKHHPSILGV
jgi:hypothetical protein